MLPVIAGIAGAALVVGIVSSWVASESDKAEAAWYSRQQDLSDEMDYQRERLNRYKQEKQQSVQFYHLVNEHYKSVQMGNAAYQLVRNCNEVIETYRQAIGILKARRKAIGEALNSQPPKAVRDTLLKDRQLINDEVDIYYQSVAQHSVERDTFLQKVRDLNEATRHLKLMIRDTTGDKGRDWFMRGEARRLARR